MNKPDQPPASVDDSAEPGDEELAEQSRPGPIVVQRKAAFIWLAATAGAASLLTVAAIVGAGRFHSQEEISRLEATVGKLNEEKQLAVKQLDELRRSHYAQVIAERRCEVIDGLEDCLKAGLKRPERFAESDRQFLEAKRAPQAKPDEQAKTASAATTGNPPTRSARAEPAASARVPDSPPTTRKLTLDEFAQELGKIPGVAVDGNISESPGNPAPAKKARTGSGKPDH